MANEQTTSHVSPHQFTAGMKQDLDASLVGPDSWTHARNAVNNSHDGKLGDIGNEPANMKCVDIPYTYIGAIHVIGKKWAIFSTDNVDSEIGLFDESVCSYTTIVNDKCLGFNTSHLITGASRKNFDCTYSIYWDDGINPSRQLNIDRPAYKLVGVTPDTCSTNIYDKNVDCEKLRMARIINTPKVTLSKGSSGGELANGSYQVAIAYTVNQVRVSDYFTPSNIQSIFSHRNLSGSLEIILEDLDTNYDEYEIVVISFINQKTNCVKLGNYNTRQNRVFVDFLQAALPVVDLALIPMQTPIYEKSDSIWEVNDYLLRVGVYTKPEFNYQILANKIVSKWVALELPADYYQKGGHLTSYMRDEQYSFFIRWIYNTGHKSATYHIPGREASIAELSHVGGDDAYEVRNGSTELPRQWQVTNTATQEITPAYTIPEGKVVAQGYMGYWESTERYPTNQPDIWGDQCGQPIKHHKFPDSTVIPTSGNNGTTINVLGVKFENIQHPLDFDGTPMTSVVGYEILRGTREGNKSIVAKGLINNTGQYDIPGSNNKKGLYPNYPFNDLRTDPFLSQKPVKGGCQGKDYVPMGDFRKDIFTFHSPDTQFKNPFLSAQELKIESEDYGDVTGNYEPVFKHPRHKMLRDFALFASGIVGIGTGLLALGGKKTTSIEGTRSFNAGIGGTFAGPAGVGITTSTGATPLTSGPLADLLGTTITSTALSIPAVPFGPVGALGSVRTTSQEQGLFGSGILSAAAGPFLFTYFLGKGVEEALRIMRAMLPWTQFAYQYNSHGFYNNHKAPASGNKRRKILDANYLEPYLQEFTADFRVNNLYRSRSVILQLDKAIDNPSVQDTTRKTIGDLGAYNNPTVEFQTTTSAYYVALKNILAAQYGQIDSINQVPVSQGLMPTTADINARYSSPVLFGGDVYINRYTEKNSMFFFNDWLFDQPDGYPLDYRLRVNVPYPRYWINTQEYDVSRLMEPFVNTAAGLVIGKTVGGLIGTVLGSANTGEIVGQVLGGAAGLAVSMDGLQSEDVLPNDLAHLDRSPGECTGKISFGMNKAYFYLFANGVRDFFVESEINVAHRDHDDTPASRHYDYKTYTDVKSLFSSDIIKAGNNFKYDYSLSASRLLYNYMPWGKTLPRDYDPKVAEQCYSYYPNRVIYSLPQSEENKKDNWSAFLANNYKDFHTTITAIKSVHKSGAIIYFDNDSPVMFQGVDTLQTEGGIKVTIGDGGLFQQPLQSTSNADSMYEYGACQNKGSIIGLPSGVYSISQNQGKIFQYGPGLNEISSAGNKWWFAKYLPSILLKDYPQFELKDNPVIGVGCLTGYDNTNEVVYFTKVDYAVKPAVKDSLVYIKGTQFSLNGQPVQLGDPNYFYNASFTVSFDAKTKAFISFHDWVPQGMLASSNHILTIKDNAIWKHNDRCDLFCNFYGVDYPFEIEIPTSTSQEVTTVRSYEYLLEAYKYMNDCRDQFHILDENFDRVVVHNSEQCSGLLKLNVKPKNDPWALNRFPSVGLNGVDVLFSKEENKYRFNAFFDLVKDRGEFSGKENPIWNVKPNGYDRDLNTLAIDYSKNALQRKKFRHYTNHLLLRKNRSNNVKLLLKLVNQKELKSFR